MRKVMTNSKKCSCCEEETEEELLKKVKAHAQKDRSMSALPYEMLAKAKVIMKEE